MHPVGYSETTPPNSSEWPLPSGIPINQLSTGKQLLAALSQLSPLPWSEGSPKVCRDLAKRGFALGQRRKKGGPMISFHLITFSEI